MYTFVVERWGNKPRDYKDATSQEAGHPPISRKMREGSGNARNDDKTGTSD